MTAVVPEPPAYRYFGQLLARITATEGFEAAAGSPSEDWLPHGPGYVIACELVAGATQWYGEPHPGVGNDDLRYLLVERVDDEVAFSLHPTRENAGDWVSSTQGYEGTQSVDELYDLANGVSYQPRLNVAYSWVQSICVLDGSEADPSDHSTHAHREVVHP